MARRERAVELLASLWPPTVVLRLPASPVRPTSASASADTTPAPATGRLTSCKWRRSERTCGCGCACGFICGHASRAQEVGAELGYKRCAPHSESPIARRASSSHRQHRPSVASVAPLRAASESCATFAPTPHHNNHTTNSHTTTNNTNHNNNSRRPLQIKCSTKVGPQIV